MEPTVQRAFKREEGRKRECRGVKRDWIGAVIEADVLVGIEDLSKM